MKKILFAISLLVLLELITRMLCPHQNILDKILNVLEEDSVLFWRHKSKLNLIFEGCNIRTNSQGFRANKECALKKKDGTIRIICLGASPTFGWGVDFEYTYSRQLENILKESYPKRNFEVINAGVIGYSSYQGLLFFKNKILRYSPDIISVAYVINDVDRHRFFRSNGKPDKELISVNPAIIFLRNSFKKSRLYNLIEKSILAFEGKRRFMSGLKGTIDPPKVRVSPQDYQYNLEEIFNIAKRKGIKVVFVKMPVNLPLAPYVSETSKEDAKKHISLAINCIRSNKYHQAMSELKDAIALDPYSSNAYFYQGVCYEKSKQYKIAEELFNKAKSLDAFRCRLDSQKYNKIMGDVAVKYKVPLVDVVTAFANQGEKELFVDPKLDPTHPNKLGHKIIAEEIFKAIKQESVLFTNQF